MRRSKRQKPINEDDDPQKVYIPGIQNQVITLNCPICTIPQKNPYVAGCGHIFCQKCIKQCHMCPFCRYPFRQEQLVRDVLTERIVQKLKVKCTNKGCDWTGPAMLSDQHMIMCPCDPKYYSQKLREKEQKNLAISPEEEIENEIALLLQQATPQFDELDQIIQQVIDSKPEDDKKLTQADLANIDNISHLVNKVLAGSPKDTTLKQKIIEVQKASAEKYKQVFHNNRDVHKELFMQEEKISRLRAIIATEAQNKIAKSLFRQFKKPVKWLNEKGEEMESSSFSLKMALEVVEEQFAGMFEEVNKALKRIFKYNQSENIRKLQITLETRSFRKKPIESVEKEEEQREWGESGEQGEWDEYDEYDEDDEQNQEGEEGEQGEQEEQEEGEQEEGEQEEGEQEEGEQEEGEEEEGEEEQAPEELQQNEQQQEVEMQVEPMQQQYYQDEQDFDSDDNLEVPNSLPGNSASQSDPNPDFNAPRPRNFDPNRPKGIRHLKTIQQQIDNTIPTSQSFVLTTLYHLCSSITAEVMRLMQSFTNCQELRKQKEQQKAQLKKLQELWKAQKGEKEVVSEGEEGEEGEDGEIIDSEDDDYFDIEAMKTESSSFINFQVVKNVLLPMLEEFNQVFEAWIKEEDEEVTVNELENGLREIMEKYQVGVENKIL